MTSTLTTSSTSTPDLGVPAPGTAQQQPDGIQQPQAVRRSRHGRWLGIGCAAALVAAAATGTVVVRHGSTSQPAPVASPVRAIGVLDTTAGQDGREWEQRALTRSEAPNRGVLPPASPQAAAVSTTSATTFGTGNGRLMLQP